MEEAPDWDFGFWILDWRQSQRHPRLSTFDFTGSIHNPESEIQYQNNLPASIWKCSANGPSANAGKYSTAPTNSTTPASTSTKVGVVVWSVPAVSGAAR